MGSAFLSQHRDQGGNYLHPTLQKGVFRHSKGRGLKMLSDPQFPVTLYAFFISYSLPTTLSPFSTVLVRVFQSKFYMTCALAFTRFSLPPPKNMGKSPPLLRVPGYATKAYLIFVYPLVNTCSTCRAKNIHGRPKQKTYRLNAERIQKSSRERKIKTIFLVSDDG